MLAANLYEATTDDRRTTVRPALGREGTIRTDDVAPQSIVVHDLTRDGCRITTRAACAPGDVVGIGIGGVGVTLARIAWAEGDLYGCSFVEPLRPGRVTAAFEASNLVALPTDYRGPLPASPDEAPRWSRARTATVVLGGGLLCWTGIGAIVLALI